MSIFPTVPDNSFSTPTSTTGKKQGTKEPLFDFKSKKMIIKDGKVVYGDKKQQIQQWITLLIHTKIDKFNVYKETWFGMTDLYNLRGHQFLTTPFGISEVKREIREKLEKNERIQEVIDLKATSGFNSLNIEITVIVDDEEVTSEVIFNE